MVPRITSRGKSFKGAGQYFLHDLGKAETSERVDFTYTVNMLTDDPEKAIKVMAWTAEHAGDLKTVAGVKATGRQSKDAVYNYVLAWAPDQNPERTDMVSFGLRSLAALGLSEHEALFVAHGDTDHKHLHVIANRVHPVNGKMATVYNDQLALSRLAQAYELETGRVYCEARVANNQAREKGQYVKGEPEVRQTETTEYQARRAARIEAQRQAAAVHAARLEASERKAEAGRELRAAFDQDLARDPQRPAADARKDGEEKGGQGDQDRHGPALREQQRRAWLDEKRAADWRAYEADHLQRLTDKQTERREGLNELQADGRARLETRLERKYAPDERLLDRKLDDLKGKLADARGPRGLLDRLTGRQAERIEQLQTLEKARAGLDAQRQQERTLYAERQGAQRTDQARRQEAERAKVVERLNTTKARQDAVFEAREKERAERMQRDQAAKTRGRAEQARAQAREAQRIVARDEVAKAEEKRAQRARQTHDLRAPSSAWVIKKRKARGRGLER